MALTHVRADQREEALAVVDTLQTRWRDNQIDASWGLALAYAALKEHEEALHWLEIACGHKLGMAQWLYVEPVFHLLHDHPRFQALVKQLGLDRAP